MKPYFDAGFKDLAKAAGYPVASIQVCGQFKRTHCFLLEVWEALYRAMITVFLEKQSEVHTHPLTLIANKLSHPESPDVIHHVTSENFKKFKAFIQKLAKKDETWRFWVQCVFQDLMAYIGLFLAIRSGDWSLRVASIKQMAATFTAFDHHNYTKLISQHLADLLCMPQSILTMLLLW